MICLKAASLHLQVALEKSWSHWVCPAMYSMTFSIGILAGLLSSGHAGRRFPGRSVIGMDLSSAFTDLARQLLHAEGMGPHVTAEVLHYCCMLLHGFCGNSKHEACSRPM